MSLAAEQLTQRHAAFQARRDRFAAYGHLLPAAERERERAYLQRELNALKAAEARLNRANTTAVISPGDGGSQPMSTRAKTGIWGAGLFTAGVVIAGVTGSVIGAGLALMGMVLIAAWVGMLIKGWGTTASDAGAGGISPEAQALIAEQRAAAQRASADAAAVRTHPEGVGHPPYTPAPVTTTADDEWE